MGGQEEHVLEHLAGNMSGGNSTENHEVHTVEGGILTGRNPFEFHSAVPLPTFIIQLLIIICMSRLIKLILSPIKQPCKSSAQETEPHLLILFSLISAVIAEIISGILLGPTGLGHIPYFSNAVFPKPSLPFLNLMSNFGLVLFLFLVGLELDPRMLKKSMKKSLAISLAGMALPFGVGIGVSYALYTIVEEIGRASCRERV